MSRTFKEECAELPEALRDAVTAVVVTRNFRTDDVLTVARRLAPSYQGPYMGRARDLFELVVGHLEFDGAKPAETVIETRRRITLSRQGDTNVIRVFIYSTGNVDAHVMREAQLVDERRRCRNAFYRRLTTRPISNDNDPETGASRGLLTRMAVKGRLASIANDPALRLRGGVWVGG